MSKAAIYCRLSEEDRNKKNEADDSGSIQNQKAMLLEYAAQHSWEVYDIYSDDNYTGSDRNRPAFTRMLEDAEVHRFDIILCKSQSRFTRELELVEKYINGLFPIWGIRFISLVDNADTSNKGNKKARQINGLVNEWYLEDMSENIRAVLTSRRKGGFHIGAFAPYGYKKDPEQRGRLLIDEEAAAVVREIFTLFSQGYGKTAIARLLNERGIPNPTEYKRLHGLRYQQPKGKTGALWKYAAISGILTNELYIGNMVQGRYGSVSYKTKQNKPRPKEMWYRVEETHEAIIDRDLWDRVQALSASQAKPFRGGTLGLFARKVLCASCGYTMRSTKSRGKHYLQCASRRAARDACPGAFISVDTLERLVIQELNSLSRHYLDQEELVRRVVCVQSVHQQRQNWLKTKATLLQQLGDDQLCLRCLYLDKVKGIVSEEDYRSMAGSFSEERKRTEHLIVEAGQPAEVPAASAYDGQGRYLIPGYIDTHMHVESTMMIPENLSRAILPWGTTTICTDPHEIGNVMGVEGVRFMLGNAKESALRQYVLAPSCVPAVPELESTGASFGAKEVGEILDMDDVVGIAEIMDFVGVYQDGYRMHSIIDEGIKRGMYLQGHAPYVSGKELAAYRLGGRHRNVVVPLFLL